MANGCRVTRVAIGEGICLWILKSNHALLPRVVERAEGVDAGSGGSDDNVNPISASASEGVPKSESVIIAEVKLSCPGVSQCRQLRKVWVDERSISRDHQTKPVVSCDDCVGDTLGRRGKAEG